MKAMILAGGRGKRAGDDITNNKNKCMTVVNGRPLLEYSLDNCIFTDVTDIIIVVGYKAEDIINYYGNSYKNKRLRYVIQWEQKGLVNAIECAKEEINGDDFMLLLGDQIMVKPKHQMMLDDFNKQENIFAICGVLWVENKELIKKTYSIIQDENNRIYRLIEKPRTPLNNIMGTGDCIFKNEIYDYIELTPISHVRKEKELPDLIQCAIDDGKITNSYFVCDRYVNFNTKEDLEMISELKQQK